jgi:hypothetical protein
MLSILLSRRARKKELSQDNEEQPAAHRPRRMVVFVALSVAVLLSMVSIVVSIVVNEGIASTSLGKLGGTSHVDGSVAARPSLQIPTSTSFCLVHVGKTAGSKVACELGQVYGELHCRGPRSHPSALKHAFAGRTHMWGGRRECEEKNFTSFLYILRNPLDRLVSWYFYEHPRASKSPKSSCSNKFHHWENNTNGCFDSLDEFAVNAVLPTNGATSNKSECQRLAFSVARGEKGCNQHNAMGYAFYENRMKEISQANITYQMLAIRTEHLADDWDQLDQAFGGHGNVNGSARFQTRSGTTRSKHVDSTLSDEGRTNLCFGLCEEIQVYKKLLIMAQNLDESQLRESIAEVVAVCPRETFEIRECPSPGHTGA